MTFGLIQYVAGRRHLAGRTRSAEFALAPDAMRRAVRGIVLGLPAVAVLAALSASLGRLNPDRFLETSGMSATTKLAPAAFSSQTMSLRFLSLAPANGIQAQTVKLYDDVSQPAYFGVNGAIAVAAGLAVTALAPWLRRTTHPVH